MAVSEAASGTQVAVVGTEHTLATDLTAGAFVPRVDLTNMASGDTVEIRTKVKVLAADASHLLWNLSTYSGAQTEVVVDDDPVASAHSIQVSLKQTAGTGRSFKWSLLEVT